MSTFNLRNQNDALPETFNLGSRGLHDAYRTMPMAGAGEMRRGWESSGLGLRANELYGQANLAETEGDLARAQALKMQADDLSKQASAWAPSVQNLTEVGSIGEFGDWVAGQAGNLRSSVAPMVGGGLGAAAGFGVGLLAKNPGLGARVGSYLGAGSQAVPMARDEIIAEAMNNPEIAAGRTAQEIRNTANIGGVVSGALDAVVPGAIAGGVATLGRKALRDEIAKRGVMGTIGMGVAKEAGEEALTEGAQSLVGQTAQNQLARNDLTDYDWNEAFNAAAGGAVGGGIMGGGGKAIEVAGNRLLSGAETVAALARDPGQVIGDAIADAGGLAGKVAGWAEGKLAEREAIKSFEQAKAAMESPGATDEQRAEILKRIGSGDFGNDPGILARPEDGSDPIEIDRNVSARAQAHAEKILSKDYENDFSQAEREAAARFKGGATDYNQFRAELRQAGAAKKAKKIVEQDFGPDDGTKQSRMITYERVPAHLFEVEAKKDPFIANMMRESGLGSDMAYKLVGLSDEQLKKLISEKTGIEFDTWKKWRDGATELANKVAKAREMDGGWTPSLTQRGEESRALADIWLENEGAKRPLFKDAGEDGRTLATKVVEWVRSGFGSEYDENGQFFIPTKLVDELGQDAAKVVREVADLVERQYGSFTDPDMLPKVIEQVRQRAMNNDGDNSFIKQMLTPLAAKNITPQGRLVLLTMLRNLKGRPSKAVRAGLEEMFGTRVNDVLLHFTPKASEGRYGDPAKNGKGARTEDTEVVGIDENGELILSDDLSYGTKEDGSTYEVSGPELIGVGESNRAFDAPVRGGKKEASADRDKLDRLIQQMSEDRSVRVREVGAWDDIRQNLKGPENEKLRREAENDLISEYLPDWADELGAITTGAPAPGDLDELTLPERKKLLNMINQRFRFIVKEPNNAVTDPGKLPDVGKGSVADYKFTLSRKQRDAGMTEADLTVKDGFIFLERNYGGRTSSFPVRTDTLLSKRAFDATSDSPVVEGQQGVAGINKQVLSMLSNIIFSGTGFTGRIGYRKEKGGEMHWLRKGSHGWVSDGGESRVAKIKTSVTDDQGNRVKVADAGPEPLPGETKLGKSGTVADAREQENFERRSEKTKGIAYAETHAERVQALTDEVRKAVEGKRWYVGPFTIDFLTKALKANRENEILSIYYTIRNQADGKIDDFGGTPTLTVRIIDAQRGYRPTNEIDVDLDKLRDARNKFNGATDNQLVDRSSSADRTPSEGHDSTQTGIRREDPEAPEGDGEGYFPVLTRPLPGALAQRLSEHDRLVRKSGVPSGQLENMTAAEFTKAVSAKLSPEDQRKFSALRSVRENDLKQEAAWYRSYISKARTMDGAIQRNEDGAAQGFGTDAEGAGYGGNSRGGSRGAAPLSEPANTSAADAQARADKALKALERMETARDWALGTLVKDGVQGIFDAVAAISSPESVARHGVAETVARLDTLKYAVLGRDVKKTVRGNVTKTSGADSRGRPLRVPGEVSQRADRTEIDHNAGLADLDGFAIHYLTRKLDKPISPRRGHEIRAQLKENATVLRELFDNTRRGVENGETSGHSGSAKVRPTDTRGQADARGAEARVAEGDQRQRADGESGPGASGQGQQTDAAGRGVAQQLQAYLDQHGSKNAVWANVSRKALASGDQKQIAGALAAARKQFGELATTSETPGAKNTLNVYWGAGENKELSNLAPRPFEFEGRQYRSVEHAYQSLKSGEFDADAYARGKTVAKAPGRLGTKTSDGWNVQLMKRLMKASFEANPSAAAALKATGDAQITHNQDRGVWKELFPKLLMEVRSELSTPSENRADTGSTTPASANLVDLAKPPAFAREKELAKLDGADFIFAPLGVQGSFASRLAQAAKDAGKLIDPNGTENIRDKVVYISVPGASRKFEGMDAFLADIRKLMDRGAIIRTDTKERASTSHNAEGEGRLRTMLALMDYNLTEGQHYDSWQKNLPASWHKKGVVGDAAVATPTSGPGSMQQPHSLPMSYKIYNIEDIRPELRSKYKPGDGIAALIPNGDRTATTRNPPAGVKVGHIIKFPGVEGLYRVTGFEKIDLSTPEGREKWSKREGWDVSMTDSFGKQVRTGATQMLFERVDSASTLASTGDDSKQAKRDAFVFKIANMSMKDMRAYVDSIPDDKLSRAYDVLDTFYPVDNTNPFWQRNDLNKYSDQMDKVLFEALDRIATRLSDIEDDSDGTKYSRMSSPARTPSKAEQAIEAATNEAFNNQLKSSLEKLGFSFNRDGSKFSPNSIVDVLDIASKRLTSFDSNAKRAINEAASALSYLMISHPSFADVRELINKDHFSEKAEFTASLVTQGVKRGDALVQANRMVLEKLIKQSFSERAKSPVQKIVDAVKRLLGQLAEIKKSDLFAKVDADVAALLNGSDKYKGVVREGFEQVSFAQAIKEDPHARNILETLLQGRKVALTGSLSLATQGTVFRQKGNLMHDLDFVVLDKADMDVVEGQIKRVFAGAEKVYDFSVNDAVSGPYNVTTFLVPPHGMTVSNIIYSGKKVVGYSVKDSSGKVVGTFRVKDGLEHKKGERAIFVDLFSRDKPHRVVERKFPGANGKSISGLMQEDADTFAAKLRIGRPKDINDFALYEPYNTSSTKFSKQSAESSSQFDKMTPELQQEAEAFIQKVLADTVDLQLKPFLKYNAAGTWKAGKDGGKSVLSLAMNSNIVGTAYHESLHEFFNILLKHGAENVQNQLTRVATSPMMIKKLERLLEKHPDAIEQLKDPEEALAYMFQFYQLGALKLGPETKGIFQRVWDMLRSVAGLVSERIREENKRRSREGKELLQAKAILDTFASGAVAKVDSRRAVIDGLKADVERHEQAMKALGETWIKVANTAGKLVMSAEAMMDAVGDNPYVHTLARWIHQKAGTEMRELHGNEAEGVHGAYLQGVRGETNRWMNKLENILTKYSKEDLELARQALSTGTPTYAPAAAQAAAEIKKFYEDMYQYMDKSDVRRLEKGRWVRVQPRKDYGMTQVWDVENVVKNRDQFKADLLQHHMKALERIAAIANKEARDFDQKPGVNTAADIERKRVLKKFMESGKYEWQDITPEMVADAIIIRLVNSGGKIDIEETESNLGITPLAAAVNRRSLDWLNMKVFDKYLSKDLVNIMSTYTRNMVKRAEYQKRFGYGGERLRDKADEAVLYEMGGKELVIWAHDAYPNALEAWKKALAKHMEDGGEFEDFGEPKPTLRSVGQEIHARKVGAEQFNKDLAAAVGKLEQVFKAVQAVEGTLGNDMNPTWRAASSWLITYQNLTKLSLMLFNSMTDVMGIVVNGGELGDAWNAFTTGMREIRNSYVGKKGSDELAMRAEEWGAVDASSLMDSLGQTYGSTYMTQRAKRISDAFFKYTGAEGWNRGVRMVAANVGERIITQWAKQGIDLSDPAKKAQFERLFGKDADPKDIKLDAQGRLDITDARNQAAVQRWVLDSVMAPNAATRPIWGSNPNFAIMMHLKNFTYTFHRIMLKGVIDQAALGNYRPVLVLATGYVPIMIASHAIKEMLIPGEEPPWMKNGLDSYLEYGWDRAGLLGVPQMYADVLPGPKDIWNGEIVKNFDPAALAGPSVDQLQDFLSIPLFDHKTLLEEGLQALPGGNVLQRLAK